MSDAVPVIIGVAGGVLGTLGGVAAWVARAVIFSRIDALETSRDKLGQRVGECETWQRITDAVEQDRLERTN